MRTGLLRSVGAATAVYGAVAAYRPNWLARPVGLVDPDGTTRPHTAMALRPLAWRDAASGLAMLLAPGGPALVTATAVRIASDLGDAVLFGTGVTGRVRRAGTVVTALGWAALTAAALAASRDVGAADGGAMAAERGRMAARRDGVAGVHGG
ncbi:hypothetical protein [Streptomyces sp. NRRL S-340]|uniref:hypothetical protein n=1 Tax=Streptomyces sp. NRRL S-340 TaxID=1463901 RepID=UPI000A8D307A|nr:hypothetical protein [Streptomyces sp. NRRL S-340]